VAPSRVDCPFIQSAIATLLDGAESVTFSLGVRLRSVTLMLSGPSGVLLIGILRINRSWHRA